MSNFRVGIGVDVHQLVAGRRLILGGLEIPFEKGLLGHSDADVLLHAICDALLGAASLGDIGQHFSDSDPKWKDVSSLELLNRTNQLIKAKGFRIGNIDSTLILQQPKVARYIPKMRNLISEILEIEIDHISIKATTTEGLGYEGRGEGISAQAICLLY
ncbi:MAG TPA: 2-C-methyl-D-erythritol 2,4-cyclodiphosphate synthase [Bacteroidales bacterium]|nr:2-C-methyl-D-erythritol 2,4-cyclodiphosphate synthase [Bacteroidales bacterium]